MSISSNQNDSIHSSRKQCSTPSQHSRFDLRSPPWCLALRWLPDEAVGVGTVAGLFSWTNPPADGVQCGHRPTMHFWVAATATLYATTTKLS